jgi:hypothetical protein
MKYLMKLYTRFGRIRQYSTEFIDKLQYFTAFYGHKQNAAVINDVKTETHPIPYNFVHFLMVNFIPLNRF